MELEILEYPNPRLRLENKEVTTFDAELAQEIENMFDTLYSSPNNAGLAAPQVDIHKKIFVMDISPERKQPFCVINPKIVYQEGEVTDIEACLSLPGVRARVTRAKVVSVEYLDQHGNKQIFDKIDGFIAKCVQHEMDHLEGILSIDHLSPLKRTIALNKLKKKKKKKEDWEI